MDDVVVQVIESKQDLETKIEEKPVEDIVEKPVEDVEKTIEDKVADIVDKLDDNPHIAKVLNILEDHIDGREISCSCFGWLFALRITRKRKQTPPAKPEGDEKTAVVLPSLDSSAKESPPPTTPRTT